MIIGTKWRVIKKHHTSGFHTQKSMRICHNTLGRYGTFFVTFAFENPVLLSKHPPWCLLKCYKPKLIILTFHFKLEHTTMQKTCKNAKISHWTHMGWSWKTVSEKTLRNFNHSIILHSFLKKNSNFA